MNIRRKLLAAVLALVMLLSMAVTVSADETKGSDGYIQQMLNYYRYYQDRAATDIDCLLYALSEADPLKAQTWDSIMDYWSYANTGMTLYPDVLPDGLPQDSSLCIVVMGYALAADGSMRNELVGRLETALASAEKYPNAYIACTGGGTAKNDKTVTEAGAMAQWLIKKGVDPDRIIVEDKALSTVGNALNTCAILAAEYPRVTHLALVTSDYHLIRSCLLFHAQALLSADKGAPLLCVAANAAYVTGRASESAEVQADNLSALVNIPINGMPKPKLSALDHITLSGSTQYTTGEAPDVQVIAHYDTGFYRDVSEAAAYRGIDPDTAGVQELTVTYTEQDLTVSASTQIEMLLPETEAPTLPPTEPPAEAATEAPAEDPTEAATEAPDPIPAADSEDPTGHWLPPVIAMVVLLIAAALIIKRLRRSSRRQKAARIHEEEAAPLLDDDSPLEYI